MQDFAHQTREFERARNSKYWALLMEQGTGKTRIAIKLAENHFKQRRIDACLVITTKGLVRNWSDVELPAHASEPYIVHVWPNKQTYDGSEDKLYFWLVNIDALIGDKFVIVMREFLKSFPKFMAVIDESTLIKSPSAKRTRRAFRVGQLAEVRLIMTGVPTPRSPLDLYAQCKFLSPTALGKDYPNFASFKLRHAEIIMRTMGQRIFPEIVAYKNLGELKEKLSKFSSIIKKEDCLDLPPFRQRIFPVPLTPEQRGYYDQLRHEMFTIIQNEVIDAKIVIAMINKALQICSGQIKLPDGRYLDIPNDRPEALQEIVTEIEGQAIVWTAFVNNALAIGKVFGKEAMMLPSGLSLDRRQEILERFKGGDGKILVANPASAGHGLTLVNCSNVIHYSRSFNYEHRAQADARIHRIGQELPCMATDLCDPKTLEKRTIDILTARKEMSDFMLDGKFLKQMLEET